MSDGDRRGKRLESALADLIRHATDVEAAAVVSPDGLSMASVLPDGTDDQQVAAMSAALLSLGERASRGLGRGELRQVYAEGEQGTVFLVSAGPRAVLVAVAGREAKVGMMLFELRHAAQQVATALGTAAEAAEPMPVFARTDDAAPDPGPVLPATSVVPEPASPPLPPAPVVFDEPVASPAASSVGVFEPAAPAVAPMVAAEAPADVEPVVAFEEPADDELTLASFASQLGAVEPAPVETAPVEPLPAAARVAAELAPFAAPAASFFEPVSEPAPASFVAAAPAPVPMPPIAAVPVVSLQESPFAAAAEPASPFVTVAAAPVVAVAPSPFAPVAATSPFAEVAASPFTAAPVAEPAFAPVAAVASETPGTFAVPTPGLEPPIEVAYQSVAGPSEPEHLVGLVPDTADFVAHVPLQETTPVDTDWAEPTGAESMSPTDGLAEADAFEPTPASAVEWEATSSFDTAEPAAWSQPDEGAEVPAQLVPELESLPEPVAVMEPTSVAAMFGALAADAPPAWESWVEDSPDETAIAMPEFDGVPDHETGRSFLPEVPPQEPSATDDPSSDWASSASWS